MMTVDILALSNVALTFRPNTMMKSRSTMVMRLTSYVYVMISALLFGAACDQVSAPLDVKAHSDPVVPQSTLTLESTDLADELVSARYIPWNDQSAESRKELSEYLESLLTSEDGDAADHLRRSIAILRGRNAGAKLTTSERDQATVGASWEDGPGDGDGPGDDFEGPIFDTYMNFNRAPSERAYGLIGVTNVLSPGQKARIYHTVRYTFGGQTRTVHDDSRSYTDLFATWEPVRQTPRREMVRRIRDG